MGKTELVLALATGIVLLAGCAKGDHGATTSTASVAGEPNRGKQLFAANCSQCHGATGVEGGIGPSLHGERTRKNLDQTVAWIEDPQPPMPKLYPAPLDQKDVADIAAYVTSL